MAKKEFSFQGKSVEDLKKLSLQELSELLPARIRRKIKRNFTDQNKILLKKIEKGEKNIKTHCRDMIILPSMVGSTIQIHTGKEFVQVLIQEEMIGHYFGEFALTRKKMAHSAPGVGATRSSSAISVK
jgi:small subunit ribosomal protein S19